MEQCAVCSKKGDEKQIPRCSRCKAIRYCSRDCQASDWPRHKTSCRAEHRDSAEQGGAPSPLYQGGSGRAPGTQLLNPEAWTAHLFSTMYTDPWQQARARAQAAFPGELITDGFEYDGHNWTTVKLSTSRPTFPPLPMKSSAPYITPVIRVLCPELLPMTTEIHMACNTMLLVRLVSPMDYHGYRLWMTEDNIGVPFPVLFDTPQTSSHYFRYDDFEPNDFLCLKYPKCVILTEQMNSLILVDDVSMIHKV